jgi:hypothetical protein
MISKLEMVVLREIQLNHPNEGKIEMIKKMHHSPA